MITKAGIVILTCFGAFFLGFACICLYILGCFSRKSSTSTPVSSTSVTAKRPWQTWPRQNVNSDVEKDDRDIKKEMIVAGDVNGGYTNQTKVRRSTEGDSRYGGGGGYSGYDGGGFGGGHGGGGFGGGHGGGFGGGADGGAHGGGGDGGGGGGGDGGGGN